MSELDLRWRAANPDLHKTWLDSTYPGFDERASHSAGSLVSGNRWKRVTVTTSHELPGLRVERHVREVMGITVRTRNVFANAVASFSGIVGGEVTGYTKLMTDARDEAIDRMRREADRLGANAVIAMRLDANQISDVMTEFVAYGAAVVVSPVPVFGEPPPASS